MPRRGRRTVKNSATSPRSIRWRERARECLEYRKQGYCYRQIAAEMKCSDTTVRNMILWAMDGIVAEPATQLKDMQNLRLESLLTGVMDRAIAGDGEAINACLKILDGLGKLHGLFAQSTKIEHSGDVSSGSAVIVRVSSDDLKV